MRLKKKILKIAGIFMFCYFVFSTQIFATLGEGFNNSLYNNVTSEQDTELDGLLFNIAGTVMLILQILALAGVVITGVKYMYAGSEDKGKIKQTLIWVIIGAILVFAASTVINFVSNTGNSLLTNNIK